MAPSSKLNQPVLGLREQSAVGLRFHVLLHRCLDQEHWCMRLAEAGSVRFQVNLGHPNLVEPSWLNNIRLPSKATNGFEETKKIEETIYVSS